MNPLRSLLRPLKRLTPRRSPERLDHPDAHRDESGPRLITPETMIDPPRWPPSNA